MLVIPSRSTDLELQNWEMGETFGSGKNGYMTYSLREIPRDPFQELYDDGELPF